MTAEEIREVAIEVQCQKGLTESCQCWAIAERDGCLWPGMMDEWVRVSSECGKTECCFNKLGRDVRSAKAKEAVGEFAHNREVEELMTHSHAWTDSMTG